MHSSLVSAGGLFGFGNKKKQMILRTEFAVLRTKHSSQYQIFFLPPPIYLDAQAIVDNYKIVLCWIWYILWIRKVIIDLQFVWVNGDFVLIVHYLSV